MQLQGTPTTTPKQGNIFGDPPFYSPYDVEQAEYFPAGTFSGQDKPVQPQADYDLGQAPSERPFPTVGKYTSEHFPGTVRPGPELPAFKEVHPDDLPYAQVAHDLGLSPLPVPVSPEPVEDKSQVVPLLFNDQPVRATVDDDGTVWFVARDVCAVLTIPWRGDTLSQLPGDWKGMRKLRTPGNPGHGGGGPQSMTVINEAGLYKLAFRSNKPEAEQLTDWVASEVMPSIRKHGAYMTPATLEKAILSPDFVIGLATRLKEERAQNAALAAEKAKVEFAKRQIEIEKARVELEGRVLHLQARKLRVLGPQHAPKIILRGKRASA